MVIQRGTVFPIRAFGHSAIIMGGILLRGWGGASWGLRSNPLRLTGFDLESSLARTNRV